MTRALPARGRAPRSTASWRLDGVDPKARETAREVARRSGLTLAELLNQLISQADAPRPRPRPRPPAGLTPAFADLLSRLEAVERGAPPPAELPGPRAADAGEPPLAAVAALEEAIGKVSAQIAKADARAELQALQTRESLRRLRHRIDRLEAEPMAAPSSGADLARLMERVAGLESAPMPTTETSLVDAALSRLMGRVEEGQQHALGSLRALEGALTGLEQLVGQLAIASDPVGTAAPPPPAAPAAPADEGSDDVEAVVRDLSDQMAVAEHRSAKAITEMGQEVIRIAQSLDGRVGEVERRADDRAMQMGGEMSRLAHAVDDRLSRADDARTGALEELGGQIASVADQLAERITASEHRSAQIVAKGLDDVGERLQRAVEKLNAHYERAADDIAERVSQGERTAKLVAAAYAHLDDARPRPLQPAPQPAPVEPAPPEVRLPSTYSANPFEARYEPEREPAAEVNASQAPPAEASRIVIAPPAVRSGSHRELIEQARAAARVSAETSQRPAWKGRLARPEGDPAAKPDMDASEVLVLRSGLGGLLKRRRNA